MTGRLWLVGLPYEATCGVYRNEVDTFVMCMMQCAMHTCSVVRMLRIRVVCECSDVCTIML